MTGVLVARGLLYIPIDLANGLDGSYDRLDLAIYSPLCLALGAGTAWLLTRGSGDGLHGRRLDAVGAGQRS